jgi:hypothetical protein
VVPLTAQQQEVGNQECEVHQSTGFSVVYYMLTYNRTTRVSPTTSAIPTLRASSTIRALPTTRTSPATRTSLMSPFSPMTRASPYNNILKIPKGQPTSSVSKVVPQGQKQSKRLLTRDMGYINRWYSVHHALADNWSLAYSNKVHPISSTRMS